MIPGDSRRDLRPVLDDHRHPLRRSPEGSVRVPPSWMIGPLPASRGAAHGTKLKTCPQGTLAALDRPLGEKTWFYSQWRTTTEVACSQIRRRVGVPTSAQQSHRWHQRTPRVAPALILDPSLSVLVHFAGAVHVPTRVASGHHLAARTDIAADWLCVPAGIHRRVGLPTVVARRPRTVFSPVAHVDVRHQSLSTPATIRPAIISSTIPVNRSVRRRGMKLAMVRPSWCPATDITKVVNANRKGASHGE